MKWNSGENYVDIIGYDKYNVEFNRHDGKTSGPNLDAESTIFYGLVKVGEKKIVDLAENDSIPNLNNVKVEHAAWLYFNPWYGDFILSENYNAKSEVKEIYTNEYYISLEDLTNLMDDLENTECNKVKRIYNETSCTSAPTNDSITLKCVLKREGNNKVCKEEQKTCLEIKNAGNGKICKNALVSDTGKKSCEFNNENECIEVDKEDNNIQNEFIEITKEVNNSQYSEN